MGRPFVRVHLPSSSDPLPLEEELGRYPVVRRAVEDYLGDFTSSKPDSVHLDPVLLGDPRIATLPDHFKPADPRGHVMVEVPRVVMLALLDMLGGTVVIDRDDMASANTGNREIKIVRNFRSGRLSYTVKADEK